MPTNVTKKEVKKVIQKKKSSIPKFKIDEMLYDMPYNMAVLAKKQIPQELNISRQTFQLYRKATLSCKVEIPSHHFLRIALFFNIHPAELVNYDIAPINIIDDTVASQKIFGKKLGLVI